MPPRTTILIGWSPAPRLPAADGDADDAEPAREARFTLDKVDNCRSITRTVRTLDREQLPLDEIRASLDLATAAPLSNAPSSPHDTRRQRADAARGHPYQEFLSVADSTEKSAKVKYFADVDR
jgi:hypothetical protein